MAAIVLDRDLEKALIRRRRATGADRFDEVWDGMYVMAPNADNEHFDLVGRNRVQFRHQVGVARPQNRSSQRGSEHYGSLGEVDEELSLPRSGRFLPGQSERHGNPLDRRVPTSPSRSSALTIALARSLDSTPRSGVKELLLVGRKPWSLELYRLTNGELKLVDKVMPDPAQSLTSQVLPHSASCPATPARRSK